jgi:hypothetical protein
MPKAITHRRLFALSGIVPLGVFVAVHLLAAATGVGGEARFTRTFSHGVGTTVAIVLFVLVPLAFHATYGVAFAARAPRERPLPTWRPGLRRAAAWGTFAFVVVHGIELPLRVWTGRVAEGSLFDLVSAHLSSTWHGVPLVALLYLLGVAATLAHLALELWAFFPAAGVVLAHGGRRALAWSLVGGATALFLVAANTVVFFATGARLVGSGPPAFVPDGPPAPPCSSNGQMAPK